MERLLYGVVMTDREKRMIQFIEFLLNYANRIGRRQVVREDWVILAEIRAFLKEVKNEKPV